MPTQYDIAAHVWPSYPGDEPRKQMFWPKGNGEWETIRKAKSSPAIGGREWRRSPPLDLAG